MKIAYTCWTWMRLGPNATQQEAVEMFEQSVKEVSHLGYDCVENFAFIADYFPDPQVCRDICDKYNLPLVNVYGHFTGDPDTDIPKAKKQLDFLHAVGGKWFNCQHGGYKEAPYDRPLNKEAVLNIARISEEVGAYAKGLGITLCFHPHAGTLVFTQEQIDFFMQNTNPDYVSMCIDTAHTTIADICPSELARTYRDRIGFIHLKDVDPAYRHAADAREKMGFFHSLGLGTVDFRGFVNTLREGGYDGVLCVELDRPEICNFRSAQISRDYIRNTLGL